MSTQTITLDGQTVTLVSFPASGLLALANGHETTLEDQVAVDTSPFTRQSQAQKWLGGDLMSAMLKFKPLTQDDADDCDCFLMELRGRANAFLAPPDPLRTEVRGTASGTLVVDNTVAGGNAPGSETIGLQGFTPNAVGVLKRGDWIQVGFRAYRCLATMDADASGKVLMPIWPSIRETPSNDGNATRQTNAAGSTHVFEQAPLDTHVNGCKWSDFALSSAMPSDAVITGIYPSMVVAASDPDGLGYYLTYGVGLSLTTFLPPNGNSFTSLASSTSPVAPGTTFTTAKIYGASIGAALSALAGQDIAAAFDASLGPFTANDTITVTGVGFAIYYTSATPVIDPQMPPPFAVPGGSGLAWALPSTTVNTGSTDTGTSTSSACVDNGAIVTSGPQAIWRLKSNSRVYSADVSKLTRMSFAVEEYR